MTRLPTILLLTVASIVCVSCNDLPPTGDSSSNSVVLDRYGENIMRMLNVKDHDDNELVQYLESVTGPELPEDNPMLQQMRIIVTNPVTASFFARRLLNMRNENTFFDLSQFKNALETMKKRFDISVVAAFLCGFLQYEIKKREGCQVDSVEGIHLQRYLQLAAIVEAYCEPISSEHVLTEYAHMFEPIQPEVQQHAKSGALIRNSASESDGDNEEPTQSDFFLEYILQHPHEFLNNSDLLLKLFRCGIHFKLGKVMNRVTESVFQARREARIARIQRKPVETDYSLDVFKLLLPYVVDTESGIGSYLKDRRVRDLIKPLVADLFNNPGFRYDFQFHKDHQYMMTAVKTEAEGGQIKEVEFLLTLPGNSLWITPAEAKDIRKEAHIQNHVNLRGFVTMLDVKASDLTDEKK